MLDLKRLVTKVQKTLRVQRLSATTGVKLGGCDFHRMFFEIDEIDDWDFN
jgi:hypothetical protein